MMTFELNLVGPPYFDPDEIPDLIEPYGLRNEILDLADDLRWRYYNAFRSLFWKSFEERVIYTHYVY